MLNFHSCCIWTKCSTSLASKNQGTASKSQRWDDTDTNSNHLALFLSIASFVSWDYRTEDLSNFHKISKTDSVANHHMVFPLKPSGCTPLPGAWVSPNALRGNLWWGNLWKFLMATWRLVKRIRTLWHDHLHLQGLLSSGCRSRLGEGIFQIHVFLHAVHLQVNGRLSKRS